MTQNLPALVLPPWLEYSVTGTLILLALWLALQLFLVVISKFKAGKAVDDRVIAQLSERDSYIKKLEGQVELYFNRNISLTDKIITLSQDYLAKATDFGKGMDRAFSEIKTVREEVMDCKESHKECTTRVEELSRMVAQVAVNAAPAERHTTNG